jgi:hypothetical protein
MVSGYFRNQCPDVAEICRSFREIELFLFEVALDNSIYAENSWVGLQEKMHETDGKILGFLNQARRFLEQGFSIFHKCTGEAGKKEFRRLSSEHYVKSFSYRLMEALRNYVQHCNISVGALHVSQYWSGYEGNNINNEYTTLYLLKEKIQSDPAFKKTVADEMEDYEIDLRKPIREYMVSLSEIHKSMNKYIEEYFSTWESQLQEIIVFLNENRELYSYRVYKEDSSEEAFFIYKIFTRLNHLKFKNRMNEKFHEMMVSNYCKSTYIVPQYK